MNLRIFSEYGFLRPVVAYVVRGYLTDPVGRPITALQIAIVLQFTPLNIRKAHEYQIMGFSWIGVHIGHWFTGSGDIQNILDRG